MAHTLRTCVSMLTAALLAASGGPGRQNQRRGRAGDAPADAGDVEQAHDDLDLDVEPPAAGAPVSGAVLGRITPKRVPRG